MSIPNEIHNGMDIIDSRDIIARINWLESEPDDDDLLTEEEQEELEALQKLQMDCEDYSEWGYGMTLIRDSYFEEYAEGLAEDIGAIDRNANWPLNHIDWEAAANDLKMDHTCVDFDGVDYWFR
jgi:hypothetical protein